jgi:hypothetical protein
MSLQVSFLVRNPMNYESRQLSMVFGEAVKPKNRGYQVSDPTYLTGGLPGNRFMIHRTIILMCTGTLTGSLLAAISFRIAGVV